MAKRTSDGSMDPELQALPVDAATGSMFTTTCVGVSAREVEIGRIGKAAIHVSNFADSG